MGLRTPHIWHRWRDALEGHLRKHRLPGIIESPTELCSLASSWRPFGLRNTFPVQRNDPTRDAPEIGNFRRCGWAARMFYFA